MSSSLSIKHFLTSSSPSVVTVFTHFDELIDFWAGVADFTGDSYNLYGVKEYKYQAIHFA